MADDEIIEMLWGCTACRARTVGRLKECSTCGAPRTESSPEYMPDDIQAAPAITDPELLRKARGGRDWACRYCGSSVFRVGGSCAQCGSPREDSTAKEKKGKPAPAVSSASPVNLESPLAVMARPYPWRQLALVAAALLAVAALVVWLLTPRTYDVRVAAVSWRSTVHLDRYAVRSHQGFREKIPGDAFAVAEIGQRHHHDERVLDHYEDVPYTVNEFAGYRTETYSARESCGQTCYSTPRTCTSNGNGFARCTGGGEHCSTKYCLVTKTRQVSYTKPVVHHRKEPVYRSEPRFAAWYTWTRWEWGPDHDVTRTGATTKVTWPEESELTLKLKEGERQREVRELTMQVAFADDDDRFEYAPKTEAELQRFGVGTHHRIRKAAVGAVEVVNPETR